MRTAAISCLTLIALSAGATTALAGTAQRAEFGRMPDGRVVEAITLTNDAGMTVRVIALGAAIQSVMVPDRDGQMADVAIGYATLDGYLAMPEYFGATVGRVANRIAGGRFELDGKTYQTPVNNGPNALHGGTAGFDKVLWEVVEIESGDAPSVTLRYVSPDGDQGYPGELTTTATYALNDANELSIDYRATTDAPTVVNLSNHGYWNMAGDGATAGALGNLLTIPAEEYTPTDATAIPTGEFRKVEGTVFDFRTATAVGDRVRDASDEQIVFGRGYDHNWVISRERSAEPRMIARLEDPVSGRTMELISDQPGVQFYSGNFFDGTIVGKSDRIYRMGDAVVLEPQMFPDTPNQPAFGSVRLDPGQTYRNHMVFRFSTTPRR
ncbi:galactose mutarotase [Brevundimonas sp. LM2]|uniref:aldose epimerase family protein n=1 Tax=Brevundimonas sp. LM2 TaxID=1938605 RepID=UPI000983DC85|nr:aldose epimerase family protein [Brevundimonas sp. LM2]AQR62344.1 galactose mutarotase [Brevundimonas sp. LM2]